MKKTVKKIVILGVLVVAGVVVCYVMVAGDGNKPSFTQPAAAQSQQQPEPAPATAPATKPAADSSGSSTTEGQGTGMAALAKASAAKKYLFIFFYGPDDENTAAMRKVFDGAMTKVAGKANSIAIKIDNAAEKDIVAKYGAARAPMPLALAVAPSGVVTTGLPGKFEEKALLGAFASPGMEKCLKALQERKLVFLCVQNKSTKDNEAAMKGVKDFATDAQFAEATAIVQIDPSDAAEAKLLEKVRIDPKANQAVTAFLAPPGAVLGTTKGATTKDAFMATLKAAMSGGCGSGGCGPGGCK